LAQWQSVTGLDGDAEWLPEKYACGDGYTHERIPAILEGKEYEPWTTKTKIFIVGTPHTLVIKGSTTFE
jgi:hypothetical protein